MNVFDRFKTADDKTSLLFHNDLCRDNGSITVTVYNSGMLIAEYVLDNMKTSMTIAFVVGFSGTKIEMVCITCSVYLSAFSATIVNPAFAGFCSRRFSSSECAVKNIC